MASEISKTYSYELLARIIDSDNRAPLLDAINSVLKVIDDRNMTYYTLTTFKKALENVNKDTLNYHCNKTPNQISTIDLKTLSILNDALALYDVPELLKTNAQKSKNYVILSNLREKIDSIISPYKDQLINNNWQPSL